MPADVAAALPLAGLTALRLLRVTGSVAGPAARRRILITGASGGVGHYFVELAAAAGLDVTAVSSSAERGSLRISRLWEGRAAILDDFLGGMGVYLDATAPIVIELVNAFADGDQVLAEWTSKATAANGLAYDNRCAAVFTVHEGKITSVREYADTHHVANTLFAEAST